VTIQVRQLKDVRPKLPWEPNSGEEAQAFIARKHDKDGIPKDALNFVLFEAQQILGRCVDPTKPAAQSTGLVVGYVQSGKTLSFTTLSALAHDNGFGLIILIAGTKDNLREQTRERVRNDLGIVGTTTLRPWVTLNNPVPGTGEASVLANTVKGWSNPEMAKRHKKVCLVTVLKQHQRLGSLHDCLAALDLSHVPTLLIDDEADQASPNTFAARNLATGTNRSSTTYREILRLKSVLPHHTYVQYTATPQATLLMALQDALSPEFAESVSPGTGYVGGQRFFAGGQNHLVHSIPPAVVAATLANSPAPPPTLVRALTIYLLGACALEAESRMAIRTMMVHPAQQTQPHKDYVAWLDEVLRAWRSMSGDPQLAASLDTLFLPAYVDLQATVPDIAAFGVLMAQLKQVLDLVQLRDVNSTASGRAPVDWTACPYWILVGGAKLDRGFTVEGLTVTYMPRGLGDGSADSIQQRARFCGYKQSYLGYCRVYLEIDVRQAFEEYVEHEQEVHRSLAETRGKRLQEWVRAFVLHASMNPTRRNVIGIPMKELSTESWIYPRAAHRNQASNEPVLVAFLKALEAGYPGTAAQLVDPVRFIDKRATSARNVLHEAVPVDFAIEQFLRQAHFSDDGDAFTKAGSILALTKLSMDAESGGNTALIDVFVMGEGQAQQRSRDNGDFINQVFQGHFPKTNYRAKMSYGGDRDFHSDVRPTLHVRRLTIKADGSLPAVADAPWFAIHIPAPLRKRHLLQDE